MGNDRKTAILERLDIAAVVRELFPVVEVERGDQVKVNCPFHSDDTPSLSVNTAKGLFNCFGCPAEGNFFDLYMQVQGCDFKTALHNLEGRAGITTGTSRPSTTSTKTAAAPKVKPRKVDTFTYTDDQGRRLYIKERWEPARDGKRPKEFFFNHFDKQGKKQLGYKGLHVLYRLHEIIKADQVFILEGEGKVNLLFSWGLAATCLDTGAESKWKASYTPHLVGKDIVIVPDNDKAGEGYLHTVARALHGVARSVRVLRLPGLIEKQDVIDWARLQEVPEP
jgi:putative DNA primase/helicase